MKKNKKAFFLVILFLFSTSSFAQISFDKLNINSQNRVLYNVNQNLNNSKKYSALYSYYLDEQTFLDAENSKDKIQQKKIENAQEKIPEILTCYPENMFLLDNGKTMQITNCYGIANYDFENAKLKWIFCSPILSAKSNFTSPIAVSPDGTWSVFIKKISSSLGELIIKNNLTKKYVILDKEAKYSYSKIPVKWAPDSQNFIYQKKDSLYYCNPETMFKGLQLEEKFRRIGNGKIECVDWCQKDKIVFIDSDIIYLINRHELSSFSLYAEYFNLGKVIGRLPEHFDSNCMKFKMNEDATQLVLIKNNNSISYYELNKKNPSDYVLLLNDKSYYNILNGSYKFEILWSQNSKPVIWSDFISEDGAKNSAVYIFNEKNELTKVLNVEHSTSNAAICNNGKYIAFSSDEVVNIYNVCPWQKVAEVEGEKIVSLCWKNNEELCIGGEQTVRLYSTEKDKAEILFLSQCKTPYFDYHTQKVIANTENYSGYFEYDDNKKTWKQSSNLLPDEVKVQSEKYRVYTAKSTNDRFKNGIFVRNLSGKTFTFPLYKETVQKSSSKKKIAIVFDLLKSADGIDSIIALCNKYGIDVTYFVNGEFIRRYPEVVKKISASTAEVGSMFCSCVDLTANNFEITEEYIVRGLARNEDEFFAVTGKELSLVWHAPFYKSNKLIRDAAISAGYNYIDFPTDLEKIESKAGKAIESKIIPFTIGRVTESEKNIFAEKLELLINSLLDADYQIVCVSSLFN